MSLPVSSTSNYNAEGVYSLASWNEDQRNGAKAANQITGVDEIHPFAKPTIETALPDDTTGFLSLSAAQFEQSEILQIFSTGSPAQIEVEFNSTFAADLNALRPDLKPNSGISVLFYAADTAEPIYFTRHASSGVSIATPVAVMGQSASAGQVATVTLRQLSNGTYFAYVHGATI